MTSGWTLNLKRYQFFFPNHLCDCGLNADIYMCVYSGNTNILGRVFPPKVHTVGVRVTCWNAQTSWAGDWIFLEMLNITTLLKKKLIVTNDVWEQNNSTSLLQSMQISSHFLIISAEIRPILVEASFARKYRQWKCDKPLQKLKSLEIKLKFNCCFPPSMSPIFNFECSNLPLLIPNKQLKEIKFTRKLVELFSCGAIFGILLE